MTLPDLDALTTDELRALASLASHRLAQIEQSQRETEDELRAGLGPVVAQLDALIGPDQPTAPGLTSLTEVRLYTQQQMAANTGLAHELGFQALELLARATRDIARIASAT